MDYGKMGAPKPGTNAPRYTAHKAVGADKAPAGGRATKAELLARMKAAAEAKKKG